MPPAELRSVASFPPGTSARYASPLLTAPSKRELRGSPVAPGMLSAVPPPTPPETTVGAAAVPAAAFGFARNVRLRPLPELSAVPAPENSHQAMRLSVIGAALLARGAAASERSTKATAPARKDFILYPPNT